MELLTTLFPGIGSMLAQEPAIAAARLVLIVVGFILAYMGFTRKLEPLIMVPMGLGMICVNAGVLFLSDGSIGTLLLDPLVSDPTELMNILQVNCFQPIYNFMFSNGLIACLVFMGIGAQSEISFLLAKPWTSITIALFAELGTFVTLAVGMGFGLEPGQAAAVATIGGADGPMVLFTSLIQAPELFVPISIIAYLYLSLTYGGYPYLIRLMVPKKYRGIDVEVYPPEVPQKTKFIFCVVVCGVLCLLLPMAAPLILSFFIGVAVKEAEILPFQELLEKGILYFGVGISGGEEGARHGPSIMPGGDKNAYPAIQPILEAIAATAEDTPCCTYIGSDGAGHYVKMVHNGIEYGCCSNISADFLMTNLQSCFLNGTRES